MKQQNEEWIISAKRTLSWFIDILGQSEWERRRKLVVDYFKSLETITLTEVDIQKRNIDTRFKPIAVYDDWMAWYMYLIESVLDRPGVDDPLQSARIYPFFSAIGRYIEPLKNMEGIDERLKVMLNEKQNKPDSTLFELAVAILYHRNGWKVKFLKEDRYKKTPDFEVFRTGQSFWVECKRLAKVPEYAEKERREWQKRFHHLTNAMRIHDVSAHAEIIFKVPLEDTLEECLGGAFYAYLKSGMLNNGAWLKHEQIEFKAKKIDISAINERLDKLGVRANSPQMVHLITDEYDMHGNYTQLISPSEIVAVGPDDNLHVLNRFYYGIHAAYSAKWECVADSSIDKKAKDVKKTLSKAVSQIPPHGEGIIHIGYETVMGPAVEFRRHEKTSDTVSNFNFSEKSIEAVYCHAIQPLCKIGEWECAETTIFFEKHPHKLFSERLLLDPPETIVRNSTHWMEDISGKQ
ncbi:hypothetical protein [Olivibacter oleidegradans]|uniref:Uncharacterized protein n=1 Tax=Olivibacter oleidegradans TaxID=760123 RepID=A0ABV6HPY9_9SPHI